MKPFNLIILIAFIIFGIFGVAVFAGYIKIGKDKNTKGTLGTVVLWGTIDSNKMNSLLQDFSKKNETFNVKYVKKDRETFDQELLEALALGKAPDLFFLPNDLIFHYIDKIYTIPYTSYPQANFKNSFASAGEVFLSAKGVLALPISIDPLMMYYNRTMLDTNDISSPPLYWEDFLKTVPVFLEKDESKQIIKSSVALGQFSNINNAKDIITALFMQTGNPIIKENIKNGASVYEVVLDKDTKKENNKAIVGALSFYTSFSDPLNPAYSWNRSLPNSLSYFSAENSTFYFGFSSELPILAKKNPNQNIYVSHIPQIKDLNFKTTIADVVGIAIFKSSKNLNTALIAANALSGADFASLYTNEFGIPPARRDLLSKKGTDSFSPIFYQSALFAKSWPDPDSESTDKVFKNMIESVLSNTFNPKEAISDTDIKLRLLLR